MKSHVSLNSREANALPVISPQRGTGDDGECLYKRPSVEELEHMTLEHPPAAELARLARAIPGVTLSELSLRAVSPGPRAASVPLPELESSWGSALPTQPRAVSPDRAERAERAERLRNDILTQRHRRHVQRARRWEQKCVRSERMQAEMRAAKLERMRERTERIKTRQHYEDAERRRQRERRIFMSAGKKPWQIPDYPLRKAISTVPTNRRSHEAASRVAGRTHELTSMLEFEAQRMIKLQPTGLQAYQLSYHLSGAITLPSEKNRVLSQLPDTEAMARSIGGDLRYMKDELLEDLLDLDTRLGLREEVVTEEEKMKRREFVESLPWRSPYHSLEIGMIDTTPVNAVPDHHDAFGSPFLDDGRS